MKYCGNCGFQIEDSDKFCGNCGAKIENKPEEYQYDENFNRVFEDSKSNENFDGSKKSSRISVFKIIAWVLLFPFMVIYTIIKTQKVNKKLKPVLIILFAIVYMNFITGLGDDTDGNTDIDQANKTSDIVAENQNDSGNEEIGDNSDSTDTIGSTSKEEGLLKGVEDYEAGKNIIAASNLINMNVHAARNIEEENPWAGGDRYSMSYEGNRVFVYMNGDDTVNSINVGDIKVYEQGYEPFNITDYLTTSEMNAKIATMAEDLVTRTLNYPETAKFPWLDWGYARANDIYAVQSSVEAKNAFGVESDIPFYIEFRMDTESTTPVYVVLDGEVVAGNESQLKAPEKVAIESELAEDGVDKGFVIEYGTLGDYGKEETINGNKEIYYHLPAGEYRVSTTMNSAAVIVMKKEPYKNSDGYMEHETVSMNRFDAGTSSRDITVGENEKIMVTLQSRFEFLSLDS